MIAINPELKKEITGYLLVGLLGAALDFLLFYFLTSLGLVVIVSQWLSALAGFSHNHLWHHFKVFNHSRSFGFTTPLSFLLALFFVVLSGPLLEVLRAVIANIWVSKVLVVGLTTILQFLIRKKWIFTSRP